MKPRGIAVSLSLAKRKWAYILHCYIAVNYLKYQTSLFRGYKIWYDATQKLYPFGYPHAFVANQFHQFIMIFRKKMIMEKNLWILEEAKREVIIDILKIFARDNKLACLLTPFVFCQFWRMKNLDFVRSGWFPL